MGTSETFRETGAKLVTLPVLLASMRETLAATPAKPTTQPSTTFLLEPTSVLKNALMDSLKMTQLTDAWSVTLIVLHVTKNQLTVQLVF